MNYNTIVKYLFLFQVIKSIKIIYLYYFKGSYVRNSSKGILDCFAFIYFTDRNMYIDIIPPLLRAFLLLFLVISS